MTPDEIEASLCECDRPDESDNPHRHDRDMACIYWIAGRPDRSHILWAFDGELPLSAPTKYHGPKDKPLANPEAPDGLSITESRVGKAKVVEELTTEARRTVRRLKDQGLTNYEISRRIGISESTVRSLLK